AFMGTPSQNNLNLSGSNSEDDMEQTNYDRTPSTPESSNAPKETRGKAKGMSDTPNTKKKVWLTLDHLEQPCHPLAEVSRFFSEYGVLVQRDVRICYDTFPTALKHTLVDIFETLETNFGFVGRPSINTTYTKKVLGEAWRHHKSTLYKNLVKGKSPAIVKQGPAPEGVNLEDWRVFVDIYNTEKFQAASERNTINRLKQIAPACVGRTHTQIIRQQIAKEQNKPVHMVARPESYIRIHKGKLHAQNQLSGRVSNDNHRRCRDKGVNKTAMKSMEPVLDQNYHLVEENSKLWKETQTSQMNFAMQLEEIRSTILRQQEPSMTNSFGTSSSIPRSSNATSEELPRGTRATNITVIPSLMAGPSITPNVPSSICLAMSLITGLHSNPVDFYLSTRSEPFLDILGPDIVGGLFLPMLGALPDALLILGQCFTFHFDLLIFLNCSRGPPVLPPQPHQGPPFMRHVYLAPGNSWDGHAVNHPFPSNHFTPNVRPSNFHVNVGAAPFIPPSVTPLAAVPGGSMHHVDHIVTRPIMPPISPVPPPNMGPPLPLSPPPLPMSQPPMVPPPPSSPPPLPSPFEPPNLDNAGAGDTHTQVPSTTTSLGTGTILKTPPKKITIGQKKSFDALGTTSTQPSKKQKVSGALSDQSIEQLNDVTAVNGVNLREEEEQLFSGPKDEGRTSEATRRVVQEEEEQLILQKIPLQRKLAKIMTKSGIKSVSKDVERCLSLCLEERLRGLINNLVRVSKQFLYVFNSATRALESMLKECSPKKYADLQKVIHTYLDSTKETTSIDTNQAASSPGNASFCGYWMMVKVTLPCTIRGLEVVLDKVVHLEDGKNITRYARGAIA
ncbi:hypothetical protein IFM89_017127, partial [Coptis chinensis]